MREHRMSSLKHQMLIKAVVPMIVMSVLIILVGFGTFTKAMEKEVKTELQYVCDLFQSEFEKNYPGDLTKKGTEEISIYKGGVLINGQNDLLENVKQICGVDITFFYYDMRVLTTIRDKNGNLILGTTANTKVERDVLERQKAAFYNNVTVNSQTYFGYYKPLFNSDGTCAGMIFAGKDATVVRNNVVKSVLPLFLVAFLVVVIAGFYTMRSLKRVVDRIDSLKNSLVKVSDGKLDDVIDTDILKHNDEISDIGRAVMYMQKALKELVEMDVLTGIYNRRSGEDRLKEIIKEASDYNTPFSIAVGDVDFFKDVNDTYGHDAGDIVLQQIAELMKKEMTGHGYAARWGGEEFLLVYNKEEYQQSVAHVSQLLDKIRNMKIRVNDDTYVSVTMTIGITKGNYDEELHYMFKRADTLLYNGKNSGRNKVVSEVDE